MDDPTKIILGEEEKKKIEEKVKNLLESSSMPECFIDEFFECLIDRQWMFYIRESRILEHITNLKKKLGFDFSIALQPDDRFLENRRRYISLNYAVLASYIDDMLFQKIISGAFLTPTETKFFLSNEGLNNCISFDIKIRFYPNNLTHLMQNDSDKAELQKLNKSSEKSVAYLIQNKYKISVKDREIWVNNYLLSKPYAVGSNLEFFGYVRSQPKERKITKQSIPPDTMKVRKSFTKILNELGFKGEILKAFFPQRGKSTVVYRGDEITKKDLEKSGVNIRLFIKELELAHLKNSPK